MTSVYLTLVCLFSSIGQLMDEFSSLEKMSEDEDDTLTASDLSIVPTK